MNAGADKILLGVLPQRVPVNAKYSSSLTDGIEAVIVYVGHQTYHVRLALFWFIYLLCPVDNFNSQSGATLAA